jgi:hypothetical protein
MRGSFIFSWRACACADSQFPLHDYFSHIVFSISASRRRRRRGNHDISPQPDRVRGISGYLNSGVLSWFFRLRLNPAWRI